MLITKQLKLSTDFDILELTVAINFHCIVKKTKTITYIHTSGVRWYSEMRRQDHHFFYLLKCKFMSQLHLQKKNNILYFYINNVINILFIKAIYESHQVSPFKHFTFIYLFIFFKIITQGSNNLNNIFYL